MSKSNDNDSVEELIRYLILQLKKVGKARFQISDKKIIELIFAKAEQPGGPLFAEAFQLMPYIKNRDMDYDERVFNVLKMLFHSSDFSAQNKAISAISDDYYSWSHHFSFKGIKALVEDHLQMREIFRYRDFDAFYNSVEIYEAALNGLDYDKSLLHDASQFSVEENGVLSEFKHLWKIKRTVVTSLLQVFSCLAVDASKSRRIYDELVSFVSDMNYLSEFTRKEEPSHVVEEEYLFYGDDPGYFITGKDRAWQILDLADEMVKKGNFDEKIFSLLPAIKVEGEGLHELHLFRIQQIVQSALSPDSKISRELLKLMLTDFEKWLRCLNTGHINHLIKVPELANAKQECLKKTLLDLKELLKVMNVLEHVAERKFFHPIYLENLIFSVLNKLVKGGRKFYIRRMAIVASLRLHANLFQNHPEIYDGYHPHFYDNILTTLESMNRLWNGNSYLCEKMLQSIRENEQLFGINASEFESQQAKTSEDVECMIDEIREAWIRSVRLSVI